MTLALKNSVKERFRKLELKDTVAIFFRARRGVRPNVFYLFASSIKMPEKNLARILHLHPRTINNYRRRQKNLEPVESEHLLKLIVLYTKGEEVFGHVNEFNYWLEKPFWNNKEKPIDWLNTPAGVDLVQDELNRLSHGYAV